VDQQRNIAIIRRFYAAGPSDDDTERTRFFAPDAVWHVPGSNHVSGAYQGIEAITRTMTDRMQPLDDWRIELRQVMANDDLVVAVIRLEGSRRGVTVDTDGAHVFRLDAEGRVVEAWGFTVDQARLDAVLDA
jgi:ketosteroid isomerase-like protein